jgi:condensin-2 complex subunit G2
MCYDFPADAQSVPCLQAQLPHCRMSVAESFGEVYFRAWRATTGQCQIRLEHCIQDLMNSALHVRSARLAKVLRAVLSHFHDKKKMRDVDGLLHRLYGA